MSAERIRLCSSRAANSADKQCSLVGNRLPHARSETAPIVGNVRGKCGLCDIQRMVMVARARLKFVLREVSVILKRRRAASITRLRRNRDVDQRTVAWGRRIHVSCAVHMSQAQECYRHRSRGSPPGASWRRRSWSDARPAQVGNDANVRLRLTARRRAAQNACIGRGVGALRFVQRSEVRENMTLDGRKDSTSEGRGASILGFERPHSQ